MHTSLADLANLNAPYAYHFRKARSLRTKGHVAAAEEQDALFRTAAAAAVSRDSEADLRLAAFLYLAGEQDLLLEVYARHAGKSTHDLLPMLAAAVFFARQEPQKALNVSKYIRNLEQRRLCQKTAELWPVLHAPLEREPRVHLLILTYNREDYVARALEQLAATDYTNYAVYIADNGSGDRTLECVRQAARCFPDHVPVHIQAFPTNIGRPAGHNWLLTEHDHRDAEFIAIGDDDLVRVPPDWLKRMIQTARAFPGCGCVGGKALTPGWPLMVHGSARDIRQFGPDTIRLTNSDDQIDLGQFDYVDIVDHVIGCLHIFDRAAFEETGLFDISLSPCQYVDIEHHIRMLSGQRRIIYNGLIAFEHYRGMGARVGKDAVLGGNSAGNILKILSKHDIKATNEQLIRYHESRNAWLLE